jgi:hypothetical protein
MVFWSRALGNDWEGKERPGVYQRLTKGIGKY